jgi:phosphohistidine phosphatase
MRRLVLLRHAKSSWSNPAMSDWERPLNERGKRDAPEMAHKMLKDACQPSLIICSDAVRTRDTLNLLLPVLGSENKEVVFEGRIYEAELQTLLSITQSISDDHETVLVIGHNPGLSLLAMYYTGEPIEMPTCAYVEMEFQIDSWSGLSRGLGNLRSFEYPKKGL